MRDALRRMFSVAGSADRDPETAARLDALIDRVAAEIVRRELAPVAVLVLESGKPLSFLGSQVLVALDPIVRLFLDVKDYRLFIQLLEDRDRLEQLILAIEEKEDARLEARNQGPGVSRPPGGE